MGFGFENTRHRETEPVSDQAANRERLFEAEHTAEDFDDCVPEVKERTADKMEALQEAEDDFNDCEAKLNELREENPELEDPDDFSDCAKETDDRYVAEVTYTTDGEISEQEAAEQMQEAYRENDDPEDMGQLKENINENEHIQAIDAKVVERPAVQPEEQAAYQEASEAYEQSKENLEEQRAAVEEVRQELDNEGAQSSEEREGAMEPAEAAPENAEPIEPDEAEAEEQTQELPDGREEPALEAQETQETREAQEIQEERETQEAQAAQEAQESKEVQEPQEGQQAQEVQPLMEPQPAQEARLDAVTPSEPHEDVQDVQERAQEFSPLEQRAPEDQRDDAGIQPQREGDFALEESASDAGYPESREVQDPAEGLDAQIEKALGDDDITIAEVQALAQKNAAVLQDAMTERNRTDAQLQETFQLALTKPYGTDEYKATLQEYNALKDRKEQMDASIASLNKLQDQLRQKSAELCDVQIRRGEAAFEASAATVVAAQALEGQFDDVFYKRKPDKKALQSLTEQNTAAIDSLRSERDAIKLAMDGKMHELSQYITSHNMGRFDAENNSYCRRLSEEYRALEAAYGRADYHIVKLDENNISMAETLGKPYDSVQRAPARTALGEEERLHPQREVSRAEENAADAPEATGITEHIAEGQNDNPAKDTADAFAFVQQHYDQTSVCWQETANRQLESLNQQREELSAQAAAAEKVFASQHETLQAYVHAHTLTEQTATGDAQYQTLIRDYAAAQTAYQGLRQRESICEAQIQEIAASVDPQMKTEYRGMNGTNFSDSYDAYITQPQGKAVPGFGGVCGINETCSIVNQQTGSSLDEADGIREYVSKGLCVINDTYEHNGGTNAVNRSVFLEEKGLTFIRIEGAYDTGVSISLDAIARRFQAGESAGIMLKAEDLSQPALASRRFNLRKTLEENRFRFHANHATTIAGFSYDGAGNVTGVWLNDTGDWTGSNRVFIDAEKFERMQNNTKGFAVEFSRRR